MKDIIITGASYGLGYSIALKLSLICKDINIHIISRTFDLEKKHKISKNTSLYYHKFDLQNSNDIENLMSNIFDNIDIKKSKSLVLINNAATLEPIKFSGNISSKDIIKHINVNITAPFIMSSEFIKYLKDYKKEKKIINISSGAGKNPYMGWSLYCSSKASLDMYTKAVALEQNSLENGVQIISFAPGVVETQMQTLIRKQNKKDFPLIEKFRQLHKNKALFSADYVADYIIENLIKKDFVNGLISDIRY